MYCRQQLADFNAVVPLLDEHDTKIVALSADDRDTTQSMVDGLRLGGYPVLHSADTERVHELTGAIIEPDPGFLHATGFVLRPDGTVAHAVYATGPIGRLTPVDTLRSIESLQRWG